MVREESGRGNSTVAQPLCHHETPVRSEQREIENAKEKPNWLGYWLRKRKGKLET